MSSLSSSFSLLSLSLLFCHHCHPFGCEQARHLMDEERRRADEMRAEAEELKRQQDEEKWKLVSPSVSMITCMPICQYGNYSVCVVAFMSVCQFGSQYVNLSFSEHVGQFFSIVAGMPNCQ